MGASMLQKMDYTLAAKNLQHATYEGKWMAIIGGPELRKATEMSL